jgi:benzodiazapine receptor
MTLDAPRPSALRSAVALVAFLVIAFAVAALGSIPTATEVESGWYAEAEKVAWTPPGAVFGPAWTVLYILMSIAAWLVWREHPRRPDEARRALTLYIIQLVLNAFWTPVFFGLFPTLGVTALWIAAVIILVLDVVVLLTALAFWRVHRVAAVLLIPYWAWLLYATTLNIGDAILNG